MGLNARETSWILAVNDDASRTFSKEGPLNQLPTLERGPGCQEENGMENIQEAGWQFGGSFHRPGV